MAAMKDPFDLPVELHEKLSLRLVRKVAEGGMGTVYEARVLGPENFEKTVCVKMIKEKHLQDPEFLVRFVGEAKLCSNLVQQNIAQIYKLGKVAGRYYILMEYVHGVHLHDFLSTHRRLRLKVPLDLAAYVIARTCRGLEHAHSRRDPHGRPLNIVHRDISPKNIMLSSEGEVKILDFGVAKATGIEDDREMIVGKLAYMAPEQAQRLPVDHRADIFSTGLLLFELLTLRQLFEGPDDTTAAIEIITTRPIPRLMDVDLEIPPALDRIAHRALQRDPWKRYQDAGEMALDLEQFLYNRGFSPTMKTMESYLRQIFPHLYEVPPKETDVSGAKR